VTDRRTDRRADGHNCHINIARDKNVNTPTTTFRESVKLSQFLKNKIYPGFSKKIKINWEYNYLSQ